MDLRESADDRSFRDEVRTFLEESLAGDLGVTRGRGGPGDEGALFDERLAWERYLGAHGWTCVGWPKQHGGRGLSLRQQVVYHEEYARARAPGRLGIVGEGLLGPTVIAFGSPEQQRRFLPGIVAGTELWCQGYSEPDAGSDLANLSTTATRDGDEWVLHGHKVWTSLAHWADWCFVLARTDRAAPKHGGISYLLVPMDQPGVEVRPIVQATGDSEFNEVFFDGARTGADMVVGAVDDGWRVAMGTLAFERGASTLGQQLNFRNELDAIVEVARRRGTNGDPIVRQRLARAHVGLEIMRLNALRTLSGSEGGTLGPAALVSKLYWATVHRALGELAMDVLGTAATVGDAPGDAPGYDPTPLQRLFLFSRADTIYAGSNQIQRNIIAERALGLPKEPR
ncbi:MAG TPA: acyl-CoA dehydrogenase family protein [Acidimicrobiales bacterium]|nr:acyl-CoA dehydrogenase family protein [Acidimicrobiales bacterium]